MTRKRILFYVPAIILMLAVLLAVGIGVAPKVANAADPVTWTAQVTYVDSADNYIPISSGEKVSDVSKFVFLISDYGNNDSFEYFVSRYDLGDDASELESPSIAWNSFLASSMGLANGKMCYKADYNCSSKDVIYVYFRRVYTKDSKDMREYYDWHWVITVNTTLKEDDLGIKSITATYLDNGIPTVYNNDSNGTGWIGVGLTFTVKTKYMDQHNADYDNGSELLSYSIDGKETDDRTKTWFPMNYNYITVEDNLNNGRVDFRVTDIAGKYKQYSNYSGVKIDREVPTFKLEATTLVQSDTDSSGFAQIKYNNGDWSYNDVVFSFQNTSDCISDISYYRSFDGIKYDLINTVNYRVTETEYGLRFRARTTAGVIYDYNDGGSFDVKIDNVTPGLQVRVHTDNPDGDGRREIGVNFKDGLYTTKADANGKVYLNFYNMSPDGDIVVNASGIKVYYTYCEYDAVAGTYGEYGNYVESTTSYIDENDNQYFEISGEISGTGVVCVNRKYKFFIKSGAGLSCNETELEIKILKSSFKINVQQIEYTPNASGWVGEAIPVYVVLDNDSVPIKNGKGEVINYTKPTMNYRFYYSPMNIGNSEDSADGEWIQIDDKLDGKWKDVEKHMWICRFMLSASAESAFKIYAKNGAGKRCEQDYDGNEIIKIDVKKPVVELNAHIFPEAETGGNLVSVSSGEWVNGRINLTLTVRDGVSGVYVRKGEPATNGMGEPVYYPDGSIVWADDLMFMTPSLSVIDKESGLKYYTYEMEIGLLEASDRKMSKWYSFLVSTGSGVETRVKFLANIDVTPILFTGMMFESADISEEYEIRDQIIETSTVCEDGVITLLTNDEQMGHFDYYLYDENTQEYKLVQGTQIEFSVPQDKRGKIIKKLYLVSRARDYLGNSYTTDPSRPYEIVINYNNLNIAIEYEMLSTLTVPDTGTGTDWMNGDLAVAIALTVNDDGAVKDFSEEDKLNYSYFYKLVPYKEGINLPEEAKKGEWILGQGEYVESKGKSRYRFLIDFSHKSFYGYVVLSVTNEAGKRSDNTGEIESLLKIDNTTPKIEDMVDLVCGTKAPPVTVEGVQTNVYYSCETIKVRAKEFTDRAPITYFYYELEEDTVIEQNPEWDNVNMQWVLNGWTLMEKDKTELSLDSGTGKYKEYTYAFYAKNDVGKFAGGVTGSKYVTYKFVVDASEMKGTLSWSSNDGGYYDDITNMYTYMWKDKVALSVIIDEGTSRTDIDYYYSVDEGQTWYLHTANCKAGVNTKLTFHENYHFCDSEEATGISAAFIFKAVNKAGAEFRFCDNNANVIPVYIAIDTTFPEFNVVVTDKYEKNYYNGEITTDDDSVKWTSDPLTISLVPANPNSVSSIKYTYTIQYANKDGELQDPTPEREVPSDISFTTDRLDGFGFNRNAVIKITATNRSNGKTIQKSFRVKVDQVVPKFTLSGKASYEADSGNNKTQIITSGQWTNFPQVEIIISATETNVSAVTYTYVESTGVPEPAPIPEGGLPLYKNICTITVYAKSAAGLTYTQSFRVNIDKQPPIIRFVNEDSISIRDGEEHFIDLKVYVEEENIEICEYITIKNETRGFAFDPSGYILSTSSVDNTIRYETVEIDGQKVTVEYRGYVKIYVKDYAGNVATRELYILPFKLDVNNVTLSDTDRKVIEGYQSDLEGAKTYIDDARRVYFENLISRLKDRINTLENEIASYQAYLEKLSQRTSFELKSDYWEMYNYIETYNNYAKFGQAWIQDAIKGNGSATQYAEYFTNLTVQFKTLQSQMQEVFDVEDNVVKLPAINMVEAEDYNDVLTVYDNYVDLSSDQKACFTTNLYTKLLSLKKKCEILLLSDADTGVSLDADFSPMAKINVETISEQSEYYTNAQAAILNTVKDETKARAVVSIYRVKLGGEASQTYTGKIKVNLPIPEEYRQYVRFAVYEMGNEGTITPVDDMKIAGDGKSVSFTSNKLTTYVLAVRANIEATAVKEDVYGEFLGLDLDVEMIRTLAIIGAVLFIIVIVVVIIAGIRHRRFLNTYNRAYKSGIYRRGIQNIPKGNTRPRSNPTNPNERVKTKKDAF